MDTDRIVVITGAAGGIGSELVDRFLANGDTVIATDVDKEALERSRSRWDTDGTAHERLVTATADVSSEDSCADLAAVAGKHGGRVDVLVNCAGWFPFSPFEEMVADQWRRVIDINLTGTFLMVKAMTPLLKVNGWGRIVNFGSGSVFEGTPNQSHYVAAKAGVVGFTRSLARELGDHGITANVIAPGLTVTSAVADSFPPEILAPQRTRRALHRDEVATDLVGPVFFLASDDAGFITGQTLNVDGGQHMHWAVLSRPGVPGPSPPPGGTAVTAPIRRDDLSSRGFVLGTDDGDPYYWLGSLTLTKVLSSSSEGGLDIVDHRVPAGYAPPRHIHRAQDEVFFVVDGQFTVHCGDQTWQAGPGSLAFLPRGVPHGFSVSDDGPGRTLLINAPAGFAALIHDLGQPAAALELPGPDVAMPSPERAQEVSEAHGIFGADQ